jgi:hypothetical protein
MMSTWNASDKACQLREKQAAELENANKMEQQHLKGIANKKERNQVRKEEELECKRCEEEQPRKSNNTAIVSPAQPPEEVTMQINQPNPGITTLLSDMIQGNTANE